MSIRDAALRWLRRELVSRMEAPHFTQREIEVFIANYGCNSTMTTKIDWIIAKGALPEDGELVWIKNETPIEQSGYFMSRAYYHAGMYWQDANDSTKRYALNAVTHWAVMDRVQ